MDDLNKHQIVLLTLLVSFVTSIATGITTISLMEQTPARTVTSTVNRVVEKTIERVVEPKESDDNITVERTPEKEIITVVVNQEDLTIDAVARNSSSIVRIYRETNQGGRIYATNGIVISESGRIIANKNTIDTRRKYYAVYEQGEFPLAVHKRGSSNSMITFDPEGEGLPTFNQVSFADSQSVRLGQTLISIGGVVQNIVSNGIVTLLNTTEGQLVNEEDQGEGATEAYVSGIQASVDSSQVVLGSIIVNLSGDVVGMKVGKYNSSNTFTSSNTITSYINELSN